MEKKIVVHMKDGTIHKGMTHDFAPRGETFHVLPAEGGGVPIAVRVDDMKGLFYVKDYIGNRDFVARRQFNAARSRGRKAVVTFKDGEEVWGYLGDEADDDPRGFFFFPADRDDNNLRIYVVRSATEGVRTVP